MRIYNVKQVLDYVYKKNIIGIIDIFNSMLRFSVDNKELNKVIQIIYGLLKEENVGMMKL